MKYWYFLFSAIAAFIVYQFLNGGTPAEKIGFSIVLGLIVGLSVFAFSEIKRRKENGIDLFATLETDPEKVKDHMLFIMQYHGIEENLKELNDIFRNYPQWELDKWEVFRAWYKAQIDHMVKKPEIYGLTLKGGLPYSKEEDPLYDPDAPDWEQFDRPRYYYDEKEDDDNDYDDDDLSDNKKDSPSDWIYRGIGFGAVNSIFSGSGDGGSSN